MSSAQEFNTQLKALFGQIFDEAPEDVDIRRLSGGASQETYALKGKRHRAILRRAPEAAASATNTAIGLVAEAKLIAAADKAGVPVPAVLHVLTDSDGLGEGFLMEHVDGETIARPILRDDRFEVARSALTAQCGEALARIHKIDPGTVSTLRKSDGLQQLDQYEELYRSSHAPRPVFELAFAWLRDHPPEPLNPVLVHGDFRLGNLMVDEQGLAAVLDWELAHIGDPREDIAWACINSWRFGNSHKRVGGFGDLEPLLASYEAAGGVHITPRDIDWWETMGSLKWGIMCMMMYESFRTGMNTSVERAAIGRRVSENEIDLVNLLEKADA